MTEEKIYQIITIKGSLEKYIVDSMEYPFNYLNMLYVKFIVYEERYNIKRETYYIPISFLTVQPQDVLTRSYEWSREHEDDLIEASNAATKQRIEYQKALEEEMAIKAGKMKNHEEYGEFAGSIDDENNDIDPNFSTQLDPNDNMVV